MNGKPDGGPLDGLPPELDGLPPELAELDRELSSLSLAERPSFGPELRNELARRWPGVRRGRVGRLRRYAAAAAAAGVALAGVLVPPVRAALSDGVRSLVEAARPGGHVLDEMEVVVVPLGEGPGEPRAGVVTIQVADEEDAPAEGPPPTASEAAPRMPAFQPGTSTLPSLRDPEAARATVQRFYPSALQDARVGGTANVLLWVREDGTVSSVELSRGTGLALLDAAARSAASALRFEPARRNGVPIGTWVEFDIVFDPTPASAVQTALEPVPAPDPAELVPEWLEAGTVPPPVQLEAEEMLRVAMGADRAVLESVYGPLEGVLQGTPPSGADPESWRRAVQLALADARLRDPENPAPYLALARIRRNEGRRTAAWNLFQEGYRRAVRGARPVSPGLTAELSYESGRLARENWLAWRGLRDFIPGPGGRADCPAVPAGSTTEVRAEVVEAWNFECPTLLSRALVAGAGTATREEDLRREMVRDFSAAVEARPGHVGANTELLLLLAEAGEWEALLDGARRFSQRSGGHLHALLLEGLALARTGSPSAAATRFQEALPRLSGEVRAGFAGADLARAAGAVPADQAVEADVPSASPESFWLTLDPILSTPVNERLVEHWARSAHAWLRFGSLETDPARSWLRFGEPRAVRSLATDSGLRLELWSYATGPSLAFVRPAYAEAGSLTAGTRAFLRELDETGAGLRYGGRLPAPERLDAGLVETTAAMGNGTDLQIRFALPRTAPGAADVAGAASPGPALQVGVFLLGFDGTPVRVERWRVERDAGPVELTLPMDPQVREAVVELHDPASGRTFAARAPISLGVAGPG